VNDSLTFQDFVQRLNPRQMLAPLLIVMILSMMVLPLPAFVARPAASPSTSRSRSW
jgi:flagellar biosynthesis component FlhA